MLGRSRTGIAVAVLLSMAIIGPLARAADPPLSPQASAFKQEGMQDCISNYVYRGLEYKDAEARCECVFEVYARRLTPSEMADVQAMSKVVRAKPADGSDPVVIAGANALMRINHEMIRICKIK
jgi:hypothetical protein